MIILDSILRIGRGIKACLRPLAGWGLCAGVAPAAGIVSNGEFTGSLAGWNQEGVIFNTGNQAVFSDSVTTPTGLFQTVAVGEEFAGFQISFDVLNGLSPTVPTGFLPDSFFATVYLGSNAFGPTLAGGVFDEAVALFDLDAGGFFGVAADATLGASSKGAGWTRYTLTAATAGLFEGAGFLTVAFQFFDLNDVDGDSTVAVDNVEVTVLSAPLHWALQGNGVWDTGATANWRLASGGTNRVFAEGALAVFDGDGGVISVAPTGALPAGVRVTAGSYSFTGGAVGGAGGLEKTGSGLLVLEVSNTYSGATTLSGDGSGSSGLDCFCSGGVLEALLCGGGGTANAGSALWVMNASGSATGSGPVGVGAGGTLGGIGSISGAVNVAGGPNSRARLVPGQLGVPVGKESLRLDSSVSLGANSEVVFRLAEDGFTALSAGEIQLVAAGARFRVVLEETFVPQAGAVFDLMDWTSGPVTGDLDWADNLILPPGIDWDSGTFTTDGKLKVRGPAPALSVTVEPAALKVRPGEIAIITANPGASAGPLLFQWQHNGIDLPGETGPVLTLNPVALGNEGEYQVVVSNGSAESSESASLEVKDFPKITAQSAGVLAALNDEVLFQVTATGPGPLTFVWQKNGADFPGSPNAGSLALPSVALTDAGRYRVIVSNSEGSVTSTDMLLAFAPAGTAANAKPEIVLPLTLPGGQVGMPYAFQIPARADDPDGLALRQPTRFSAKGLPSGLRCDTATGQISGVPKAAKTTPFKVTLTVSNQRGKTTLVSSLGIAPLAPGLIGTFSGPAGRNQALNSGLGGSLLVKVSSSAAFSGTHDEGGKRRPFRGALTVSPASPRVVPVSVIIARGRNTVPHTLAFTLDSRSGRLIEGSLTDGLSSTPVAGWRNPWSKTRRADKLAGYYTAALGWREATDTADSSLPQGFGFLSAKLNPVNGSARLSGRLMDGSAITGSTFAGPNGQVLLFRRLYGASARGSLLGMLVLTPKAVVQDNELAGCADWLRPPNLAKNNRLFRAGFTPRFLDLRGGLYTAPAKNERILGLTDANNRALLTFARAGIETALPLQADTSFALSGKNKAVFVKADNSRAITFSVNAKTGLFKGRLTLKENNPLLPPSAKTLITRRITYQGILVGNETEGAGYTLLPQLPAVSGETPKNTAIQSAGVLLEPAPTP